jgi:hypothetical protein
LLVEFIDSFEIVIKDIINSIGSEYAILTKKLATIDSAFLIMIG